jgi:3-phenylpropionate/trans-cinnamate dioxygenase ferredoxin subunit
MNETWIDAGAADRILPEDVAPFEHEGRQYALYRTADNRYFATAGLCTHEDAELADGFVMDTIIECPLHNGRFDFTTGEAKGAPACVNLATYPVKVEAGRIFLKLS